MNVLETSTRSPPSLPVEPGDVAVTDEVAPADPGPAARTLVDDQDAYEAALSEGWPCAAAAAPRARSRWRLTAWSAAGSTTAGRPPKPGKTPDDHAHEQQDHHLHSPRSASVEDHGAVLREQRRSPGPESFHSGNGPSCVATGGTMLARISGPTPMRFGSDSAPSPPARHAAWSRAAVPDRWGASARRARSDLAHVGKVASVVVVAEPVPAPGPPA
jgi:hypothetical protein